jgi:hypothetical protein
LIKLEKHRGHRRIGVSKEDAPANPHKLPPKPLKNGLPINIVLNLLSRMPFLAVALDG